MFSVHAVIRSAMLAGTLILVSACDSPAERVSKHHERGMELAEQGEPEKAILEFRNALQIDEAHAPSLYGIAEALEATGQLREAAGFLLRVVEVDPEHVQARVKLSQAMLLGGALVEAREHAEAAYALAPEDPDVLAAKATVALELGNIAEALSAARMALALAPYHAGAGMILVAERLTAGEKREAMALVDQFLEANPENLPLNLAKLQFLAQDAAQQEALGKHLDRLVGIYPEEPGFRQALARFHRQRGDDEAAIEVMRGLVALDPENVESVMQLVRFLREIQGDEAARAELDARVAAAEDAARAFPYHRALAGLDVAAGEIDRAKARFDRLIEDEDLPEARIARARLAMSDDDRTGALELLEEVLEDDAQNVDSLALRARIELDGGDADAAVLTLRSALGEAPDRLDLLGLAAVAHERAGNPQLAGENLAAAVRVSDYAPDQSLAYVRFLRQRGRTEAAATVIDEALRRYPRDRWLLETAGEIQLALGDLPAAEEMAARLAALGEDESNVVGQRITAAARGAQGRVAEAIEMLEAIARRPEAENDSLAQLVRSYVRADRTDEAVAFVDGVLEENPENPASLIMRGALHELAGEGEAAEARYREAVAAAPQEPAAYRALIRFHAAREDLISARRVVGEGIKAVPSPADHQLRLALAGIEETEGDFAGAIETYRALYEERPDSLVVANNLASLLSDHRADDPDSVELAIRVARRLGDSPAPQFQDTYGWTLHLKGDHNAALRSLIVAVEELPENAWVHYHIGQTYAALDQAEEARTHLQRARELGGEDFPRRADIERALQAIPEVKSN